MSYTPLWGSSDSIFAAVSMKKEDLNQFMTDDLAYTETDLTPPDEHPVIYMFNQQKIRILLPFFIMNYYEMIPLIPYVHFKDNPSKSYQTSPILYVSSRLIVLGARIVWHLNKVFAAFQVNPPIKDFPVVKHMSIQVFRDTINAINFTSQVAGETGIPSAFPNVNTLAPLLTTDALIVSYASGSNLNKYWTTAYQFDMTEVQPSTTTIDVINIEGLPKQTFHVPSIAAQVLGSFRVTFNWKLPWPGRYYPKG
jgi:hypothetical protein